MSRSITVQFGRLRRIVLHATESNSRATRVSKPAASKPKSKPPTPENRLIATRLSGNDFSTKLVPTRVDISTFEQYRHGHFVLSIQVRATMLKVQLRKALDNHEQRTGEKITYEELAERTGLSRSTVESLATRTSYNTRLSTIDRLCCVLNCQPGELLEYTK